MEISEPSYLEALPSELLNLILSRVDNQSKSQLFRTSRSIYRAAHENRRVAKRVWENVAINGSKELDGQRNPTFYLGAHLPQHSVELGRRFCRWLQLWQDGLGHVTIHFKTSNEVQSNKIVYFLKGWLQESSKHPYPPSPTEGPSSPPYDLSLEPLSLRPPTPPSQGPLLDSPRSHHDPSSSSSFSSSSSSSKKPMCSPSSFPSSAPAPRPLSVEISVRDRDPSSRQPLLLFLRALPPDLLRDTLGLTGIRYSVSAKEWPGDLKALLYLPLLKSLEIIDLFGLWWTPPSASASASLHDLTLEASDFSQIARLSTLFPNLRRLELRSNGPGVPMLPGLARLRTLEELAVRGQGTEGLLPGSPREGEALQALVHAVLWHLPSLKSLTLVGMGLASYFESRDLTDSLRGRGLALEVD